MKKKKQQISSILSIFILLSVILTGIIGLSQEVDARIMNVEKKGQLTIHKYLNPDIIPIENGGNGFQGNGTTANGPGSQGPIPGDADANSGNGSMQPLPGAEFSVYGRLTTEEVNQLMIAGSQTTPTYNPEDPKPLDTLKVKDFIDGRKADFVGITNEQGQVTWSNIAINTVDLADNLYLVVETKTPTSGPDGQPVVQQPSMPVIVNVPSTNPDVDTAGKEVNNYNYDVNLYMKNYNQTEPGIEKEIDKPTHSVGEEVKYKLTVSPLAFDMNEYKQLIVTDELAPELNFLTLGHTGGAAYLPMDQGDTISSNKPSIKAEESVVFFRGSDESQKIVLTQGTDYSVSHPDKNTNGTLRWTFTEAGLKKLTGIQAGDGSRIELYFTAITNEKASVNQAVPNDAKLDFQNKWGYGTIKDPTPTPGNPDPKYPTAPKPTEVVNTLWGERWFEKRDKQNNALKLEGAEFLVRNRSVRPVTALNGKGEMVTYPANTQLYAIISNKKEAGYPLIFNPDTSKDTTHPWLKNNEYVVGWTPDWKEAYNNHWTISSGKDGRFHIEGLEYTNQIHYRKMYIFAEMGIEKVNGTSVEVVKDYHYILAEPRTPKTSKADIEAEISAQLKEHPGDKSGNGAWKFYKESEADSRLFSELKDPKQMIDYLGDQWNDYELIEVRAPEGYSPMEKNIEKEAAAPSGTTEAGDYEPGGKDVFEHPLGFTVPGLSTEGLPNYGTPNYEGDLKNPDNNVVPVPNAKLPKIPLTGGIGTFIFLGVGALLMIGAFLLRKQRQKTPIK
ncbi:hypothetical protein CBF34_01865 [Vagococcus penaei]|uniref:Uncharacterized protein n=1 Tax=Vagococcus penaei TaxID=633807 RepID=A0A1Q2D7R7_9ENTE|nr:SpaH/EbpB family LPXTG-anchored major pilin [Vagococcus penaei]AQP54382.1 hypothetical protein BW732_09180 [Vagococcus penaei]RSU06296.1 hypothetical protein CBF34_01865 [Vagococcus penaei]